MKRRCVLCDGSCELRLAGLYDDRHGYPGRFDLLECAGCGHRQLDAAFSDTELARLYREYYPRRDAPAADITPQPETAGLRAWLDGDRSLAFRWVPRNVRVLDVGCGFGRALAYHQARGCDAWGVEADENARLAAEKLSVRIRIGSFDPAMFEAGSFDVVTMDQVIEHAADPVRFLGGAASLLRAGGQLVLSTPNSRGWGAGLFGRKWINWHVPYHLQQFSRRSLRLLARKAGLEVVALRTLTSSAWLLYEWLHLASLPPEGRRSFFWDPQRAEGAIPAGRRRLIARTHELQLNHLLTRAADALGVGDNFVCVLRKPA
jgi:SAM-dependent methyltransferase